MHEDEIIEIIKSETTKTDEQPETFTCEDCGGQHFTEDEVTEIDGKVYCDECRDASFNMCDDCGKWAPEEDTIHVDGGGTVCQACLDADYGYCEDCEEYYPVDVIHSVEDGNRSVCESCYDDNYRTCDSCGYVGHSDDMRYCEGCECDYCENCSCSCDDEDGCEPNYSEQRASNDHMVGIVSDKIKFSRLVGVELEVEKGNRTYLNDVLDRRVGITHDGSLDNGVEIQTPPASCEKLAKILTDTTKTLKENDFIVNKRCGLHIHLDASDFRLKYTKIAKIAKTYYAIEDVFYKILPKSRRTSRYCMQLSSRFSMDDFNPKSLGILEKVWYGKGSGVLSKNPDEDQIAYWDKHWRSDVRSYKKEKYQNSRYLGINIHSIFYRGTLEIRHHSGTLSSKKIFHWINFNSAVVEYALKRYNEEEIQKMLHKKSNKKKLSEVAKMLRLDRPLKEYLLGRFDKFSTTDAEEEPVL